MKLRTNDETQIDKNFDHHLNVDCVNNQYEHVINLSDQVQSRLKKSDIENNVNEKSVEIYAPTQNEKSKNDVINVFFCFVQDELFDFAMTLSL